VAATPPPGRALSPRLLELAVAFVRSLALAAVGFLALVGLWWLVAWQWAPDLPTPIMAFHALTGELKAPFHDNGPNDHGVGLQLWTSLLRVFMGFGLATAVAVPLGFLIGASKTAWSAFNPIVQWLRPVSPLAWFPIALVIFQKAPTAAVFVIFITALWPTLINTAHGVASVPQDHKNVARVFKFSRWKYIRHVLAPYSLPSILTGMRISMGIAWMVIVAVEMLSGNSGIGFFTWDSYNGGNLGKVIVAIVLIGAVGFILDVFFQRLQRRTAYAEVG
jgi:nitrate/nitrite transport system permease protein